MQRGCFIYSRVDWVGLSKYVSGFDWETLFQDLNVDEIVTIFTSAILNAAICLYHPNSKLSKKNKHPWLNDKCKKLVSDKNDVFGTPSFKETNAVKVFTKSTKHM